MKKYLLLTVILCALSIFIANDTLAQEVPSSVDSGRALLDQQKEFPEPADDSTSTSQIPTIQIPENAKSIVFTAKEIDIQGVEAFSPNEMKTFYKQYIGKKISLDTLWKIAGAITKHYQDNGLFISRAYVPAQEISEDGSVVIKVVEGHVGEIQFNDPASENYIVKELLKKIKEQKPLSITLLESTILRLNDLHGGTFRSVIEPIKGINKDDGAIKVTILREDSKISGSVTVDNYNSRFLGPFESIVSLTGSPMIQHETSFTWLNGMPWNRAKYFTINHNIALTPKVSMGVYAGHAKYFPGSTLKSSNIESESSNVGIGINIQPIRQRQENLLFGLKLDSMDASTDVAYSSFSNDHVRAVRLNASYDHTDFWNGYYFINATISQGLNTFGSSSKGDANLSRTGVDPKFRKLELNWNRFQSIGEWTAITSASFQFTKDSLYSSEQIGYGGQLFGRAYDSSEIVGDQGMLGALEVRYTGLSMCSINCNLNLTPYAFFDIGKVWSHLDNSSFGNSVGSGIRFQIGSYSGNLMLTKPLERKVANPVYGNGKATRIMGQIVKQF